MTDPYLVERQRRCAEAAAERRLIAQAIGLADDDAVVALEAAGYRPETIVLLELAPAVQVAWADGHISPHERDLLLKIARREHVVPDSPAYAQLTQWLDRAPSPHLFRTSVQVIGATVRSLHPDVGDALRRKLIGDCATVAAAAGFLPGHHPDSHAAHQVIVRIVGELSQAD